MIVRLEQRVDSGTTYGRALKPNVVGSKFESPVEVVCRQLPLQVQKMEVAEKSHCDARPGLERGSGPPAKAQQLGAALGGGAVAELHLYEVDSVEVQNDHFHWDLCCNAARIEDVGGAQNGALFAQRGALEECARPFLENQR